MNVQEEIEKYFKDHNLYAAPKSPITLTKPYKKWYKGENRKNDGILMQAFGGVNYTAWKTWDLIRQLSTIIVGARYIKDIKNIEQAECICERLCQFIYDLRCEILNSEENNSEK